MARTTAYSGSNAQHAFRQVPAVSHPRSTFNRSSNYKTTFNAGKLIPFFVDEVLPGDTITLNTSIFARMATPIFPIMDNLHLDFFWFYVPNRIVWDKWAYFLGEEENPGDAELPPKYGIPQLNAGAPGFSAGTVMDYLGLPLGAPNINVSALPFRAINLIWSEFFRDQNLQARPILRKDGGMLDGSGNIIRVDTVTDFPLFTRQKVHDYFASGLPFPQKGPTVMLPLGDTAPLLGDATVSPFGGGGVGNGNLAPTFIFEDGGGSGPKIGPLKVNSADDPTVRFAAMQSGTEWDLRWNSPYLYASLANDASGGADTPRVDLSAASAATINELRQAFQIQRLLERDARSGSRLIEQTKSHFGVSVPDFRVQRPEFLAGGTVNISINPVPSTAPTNVTNDAPQGNLAAFATAAGRGGSFTHSFTEHGHILGFFAVRADLNYQQNTNRMWSRKTRFDFYWPELQAIGEQAILSKEIYTDGTAGDEDVFAYQERWAEYRHRPSIITGQFRSADPLSLDSWHLAQEFSARPTLSDAFIQDNPPVNRVVAVPSEPHFLLDAHVAMKHTRVMPVYSVPGLIDHF